MRFKRAIVVLAVLSLLAAACGDDADTTEAPGTTGAATTTEGPATTTEGPATTTEGPATTEAPDDEETVLRVLRVSGMESWVMDTGGSYAASQNYRAVLEPLLRFSADGQSLEPGLAAEWDYDPEALTITFTLQEGARFSNGDPVTAEDVIFSQGVWAAGANYGFIQDAVVSVTGEGRTVVFELAYPDNTLLPLLSVSNLGIMPADFAGMTEEDYYSNPIGAGPFKVDEWSVGGGIVLSANEYYYDPNRPYVDKVIVEVVVDETTRQVMFDGGEADLVEYLSPRVAPQYDQTVVVAAAPHPIQHVGMNVLAPPFDDPLVRQAVAYAIDYEGISAVLGPYWGLPTGILPPNMTMSAPPTKPYFRRDLARAQDLIAQSTAAEGVTVELIFDSSEGMGDLLGPIVQANLAEIGINVTLTPLESLAFVDRAWVVDSDMAMWSYGAVSPAMADPLLWIYATGWLFSGYETDTLLDLYFAYATAATPDDARAIIAQIQDDAIDAAAVIALTQGSNLAAVDPDLSGYNMAPFGLSYYDTIRWEG